jgi:hypothetical protein
LLSSPSLQSRVEDANTLSSSRSSPHHGRFFGPLDPILSVSRPYDAVMPLCHLLPHRAHAIETSRADHCRAPCRPHQIPWVGQLVVAARGGHKKGIPYPEPPILKPHIRPSSASPLLLLFLQLVLATLPPAHLTHLSRSSPSKLSLRLHPRLRGEARK